MRLLPFLLIFVISPFAQAQDKGAQEVKLFGILGCLSEYISRFDYYTGKPHEKLVESFYPGEKELADRFEADLRSYFKGEGREYSVKKSVGDQGHITFSDPWLSKRLNSYFMKAEDSGRIPLYTIDRTKLLGASKAAQFAYLVSSYDRNGIENQCSMSFVNASTKSLTVAELLVHLGSKQVKVRHTVESIPTACRVNFAYFDALRVQLPNLKEGFAKNPYFDEHSKHWKTFPAKNRKR